MASAQPRSPDDPAPSTSDGSPVRFVPSPADAASVLRGTTDQIGVRFGVRRAVPRQFGALTPLVAAEGVTDVFVNAGGEVWTTGDSGAARVRAADLDPAEVRRLATTLIGLGGRHVDDSSPFADVRLADGIRVHAVLPPVSPGGALLSIRVPATARLGLDDLERGGFFDIVPRAELADHVRRRSNLLITGATGSGKTTLLGALLAQAPPTDRLVTIEDVAELRIAHSHVVSLEARQANVEGAGRIDLAQLVREALRMRPDRLIVGECRGAELREMLSALTTGHDGGAGTLHASGVEAVAARLESLGALAGLDPEALARQAVEAFDVVVHVAATAEGRRVEATATLELDGRGRLVARRERRDR